MANHLLESTSTSRSASLRSKPKHAAADASSALESAASRLESESASWTDLSKACLHPRSARTLDGLWQGTHAFDGFGEGSEWCRSEDRREDVRDVVRRWAEECDALAGFHVAAEDLGGFGGVATAALEEIRDEYGRNVPVCVFSLRPPRCACAKASESDSASARRVSMLNEGLATATFAPETDAYIPVCASAWTGARTLAATGVNPRERYHASAIAAAAMDVATTPWRVDGGRSARARRVYEPSPRISPRERPRRSSRSPFTFHSPPFLIRARRPRRPRRRDDAEETRNGPGRGPGFGIRDSARRDRSDATKTPSPPPNATSAPRRTSRKCSSPAANISHPRPACCRVQRGIRTRTRTVPSRSRTRSRRGERRDDGGDAGGGARRAGRRALARTRARALGFDSRPPRRFLFRFRFRACSVRRRDRTRRRRRR